MKTLLAIAAAAAAFGAAPALARDPAPAAPTAVTQTVRYADLNLATEAGRSALDRRIGLAVREVCGAASDADLHGKNLVRRCRSATARSASAQREAALASSALDPLRLASGR